jgi:hypothetical protein
MPLHRDATLDARLLTLESTSVVLPAPSGADDLAAINAAITAVNVAGGGTVKGRPGSTPYKISGPIVAKSNVTLDMSGCTVGFTTTSIHTNMLANAAVSPATTATDAATTAGSAVVASATLAAAAVVGQALAVVGAGPPGGDGGGAIWLYGTVASVVGSNITLTSGNVNGIAAHTTLSGATAYLFNRDTNIRVIGGTWDGGANWNAQATRIAAGFNSHQLRFRRVDGLDVRNVLLKLGTFTGGLGWAFGIAPADCTDFTIENCSANNASTVVQGDGPLKRGFIRNCRGLTQDDMVAFGCVGFQGNDTEGDITDVDVDGIQSNGSWTAFKLFAGSGANGAKRVCRATARSIKGTTQQGAVNLVDYSGAGTGPIQALVEDVSATPGDGFSAVINSATYGRLVRSPGIGFVPADAGLLLSSCDPAEASGTMQPGAGFIYLTMVRAESAVKVTNIVAQVNTAGATLTSGQCLAGIYDMDGNLRAKTADQSTAWTTTGLKTMALTAQGSYTLTLPGGPGTHYWIAILANGTTKPIFAAKPSVASLIDALLVQGLIPASKIRAGYDITGSKTALTAAIGTEQINFGGVTSMPWVAAT